MIQVPELQTVRPRVAGSFERFRDASDAAEALLDQGVPAGRVSIAGLDVRMEEQLVGRYHWGRVSMETAAAGALLGLAVGLVAGVWVGVAMSLPFSVALLLVAGSLGLGVGGLGGALVGPLSYALFEKDRDFMSMGVMRAGRYQVWIDPVQQGTHPFPSRPLSGGLLMGAPINGDRAAS